MMVIFQCKVKNAIMEEVWIYLNQVILNISILIQIIILYMLHHGSL